MSMFLKRPYPTTHTHIQTIQPNATRHPSTRRNRRLSPVPNSKHPRIICFSPVACKWGRPQTANYHQKITRSNICLQASTWMNTFVLGCTFFEPQVDIEKKAASTYHQPNHFLDGRIHINLFARRTPTERESFFSIYRDRKTDDLNCYRDKRRRIALSLSFWSLARSYKGYRTAISILSDLSFRLFRPNMAAFLVWSSLSIPLFITVAPFFVISQT